MKILVLGKSGYVSTCFQVYMMKKYPEIQVDAISVRNDVWKGISFNSYDVVFNATGLAHNDARKGTEEDFYSLNAFLPHQLAEKSKKEGVSCFIHMSSMIVYGDISPISTYTPINTKTIPKPNNIYGKSKLMGEEELLKLSDDSFKVAIIRCSLVYGETAVDNFQKLVSIALKVPIFPQIINYRSMIYSDNLCELIRLIAQNKGHGYYFPQQETTICISKLVRDIATACGHKICMTKMFNPVLRISSKFFPIIRKVFGNEAYDLDISNHYNGLYRVVNYEESINRIAMKCNKNKRES